MHPYYAFWGIMRLPQKRNGDYYGVHSKGSGRAHRTGRKNSIIIAIISILSCAAVVLGVYNFVEAKYLFTVSYLIGAFLGVTYVIIRANTVYKTYIATNKKSIYMRRWINHFMPYKF